MKIIIAGKHCSMGCAYATGDIGKCLCPCGGANHGFMAEEIRVVAAICSKGHEKRCKSGEEEVVCTCACLGMNHALYAEIPNFESIKIVGLPL